MSQLNLVEGAAEQWRIRVGRGASKACDQEEEADLGHPD